MNKKTVATSLVEVATVFYSNIFPKIVKKYQNGIKVPVIIRHFLLCLKQKRGDYYEIKKGEGVIGSQKIC